MAQSDSDVDEVAAALHATIVLFLRRLRLVKGDGDLPPPETLALKHLARVGPSTPGTLAKLEQISPQGMGVTLSGLESRGLVERGSDPQDGRRVVVSVTAVGRKVLRTKRDARVERLAKVLSNELTRTELKQLKAAAPLLERLARSL